MHGQPHIRFTLKGIATDDTFYDVLLTVHLSIVVVTDQLNAQMLFFIWRLLYSSTCFEHYRAHYQEVKIVLYSIWYRHTETSEWSKNTKIQFYKYEYIVVKFMYEFSGVIAVYFFTVIIVSYLKRLRF